MENSIIDFLTFLVDKEQAMVLAGLIVANLFTGALSGVLTGTFDFAKFGDFWKRALLVFIAYIGIGVVARVMTDWGELQVVMWVGLIGLLTDKIMKNLNEMGLPVPAGIPVVNTLVNAVGVTVKSKLQKPQR